MMDEYSLRVQVQVNFIHTYSITIVLYKNSKNKNRANYSTLNYALHRKSEQQPKEPSLRVDYYHRAVTSGRRLYLFITSYEALAKLIRIEKGEYILVKMSY